MRTNVSSPIHTNAPLAAQRTARRGAEVGTVVGARNYVLELTGLPSVRINTLLATSSGVRALVTAFTAERVKALLLDSAVIQEGEHFTVVDEGLPMPHAADVLGRIIDPLGTPLDAGPDIPPGCHRLSLGSTSQAVYERERIAEQFVTGITLIDLLFPIGNGQRELIIGPSRSGKTTFIRDVLVNQRHTGVVCLYVGLGKPLSFIRWLSESLFSDRSGASNVIITTPTDALPPVVVLAPLCAFALAEELRTQGKNVLIVLDDIAKHAKLLREVALLCGVVPGRESYPGDLFYQHAQMMERAGRFSEAAGGGSITFLPLLETDLESMTNLIPTNAMAATDGHIFFSSSLRAQGHHPSVSVETSVTRVGKQTQKQAQKELASKVLALIVQYETWRSYAQFGEELSIETKRTITQVEMIQELLTQEPLTYIEPNVQTALLALVFTPFLASQDAAFVRRYKQTIVTTLTESSELRDALAVIDNNATFAELQTRLNDKRSLFETVCPDSSPL